jgi:hypothetical protein
MRLILRLLIFISLSICISANAAMLRVVGVQDGRTIVIERSGKQETVVVGGVEITDEDRAVDLLKWTLDSAWVMLERTPAGDILIWRTPDALFINRELVRRGYARATVREVAPEIRLNITYLGQVDPPGLRSRITGQESRTRSGTDRRSRAQPKRRAKSSGSSSSSPQRGRRNARSSEP